MLRHPIRRLSSLAYALASATAILALLAFAAIRTPLAVAQDATPVAAECQAPEVPAGTPTADGSPAEPLPEEAGAEDASPEAGSAADEATTATVVATVENYFACYNTFDAAKYVPLSTEAHRAVEFGATNLYDAIANAQAAPNYHEPGAELISVENVMTYDDGRVSADIEVVIGGHWFLHLRQFFAQEGDLWLIDHDEVLSPEPDGDQSVVGVAVAEYSITPNVATIEQRPVIIFQMSTAAEAVESHIVAVIKMPEGMDPTGILDGSAPLDQITFYGAVTDQGGGDIENLALVDLEPGVYTLVSFGSSADGQSHIEKGMFAQVTITAPATT